MVEVKGHLNPGDPDVVLERLALSSDLAELARHVWIGRWSIPPGQARLQRVLTYPGCNGAMMPAGSELVGPGLRVSTRELSGTSWVVGVLFQPAATRVLTHTPPRGLVDASEPFPRAPWERVCALMGTGPPPAGAASGEATAASAAVVEVVEEWLAPLAPRVDAAGRLVNNACRLVEEDVTIDSAAQLADRLGVAGRTLSRALSDRVGVTAKWLIERRRLQNAAAALREQPDMPLVELASELGYADQAHFTRRFRDMIGETPGRARAQSA